MYAFHLRHMIPKDTSVVNRRFMINLEYIATTTTITVCIYVGTCGSYLTDLAEMFLLELLSFEGLFLFLFSGSSPPF